MDNSSKASEKINAFLARIQWFCARFSGNRPRPFVLLSNRRCGNNMLRSALNRHPDILLETEVFLFAYIEKERKPVPEKMLELVRRNPARASVELFLQGRDAGKRAGGFTLFDWQMRGGSREQLWRFLAEFPGLHILDLRRRNRLLQWISLKEAESSRQWAVYPWQEYTEYPPIELSVDHFFNWLKEANALQEISHNTFSRQAHIELFYENFEDDYMNELSRVMRFLGVRELELEAVTRKLNRRSLKDRILNFDAFAESLKGTIGEAYFEDACERES